MVTQQGDIYWIEVDEPQGSEPGYRHPYVVIQNNVFNASRIKTVVGCMLTSTLARTDAPANVPLKAGEANLPKPSVVVVSQLITLDKSQLEEYIGTISAKRVRQILDGVAWILEPREPEKD